MVLAFLALGFTGLLVEGPWLVDERDVGSSVLWVVFLAIAFLLKLGLEVEITGGPYSVMGVWGSEAGLLSVEESRSSTIMGSCLDEVDLVVLCDAILKDFLVGVVEGFGFCCLGRVVVPEALALAAKRL